MSSATVARCSRSPSATDCSSVHQPQNCRLIMRRRRAFQLLPWVPRHRFSAAIRRRRAAGLLGQYKAARATAHPASEVNINSTTQRPRSPTSPALRGLLQALRSGSLSARIACALTRRHFSAPRKLPKMADSRAGSLVPRQQRSPVAQQRVSLAPARRSLGIAVSKASVIRLERVQILAEQEHRLGADNRLASNAIALLPMLGSKKSPSGRRPKSGGRPSSTNDLRLIPKCWSRSL
jgi:hypothetical protein